MPTIDFPPPAAPAETNGGNARNLISQLQQSAVFRDYQQAFETTTGLPLTLRAAGSFQLPSQSSKRRNPFCAFMASSNKSCAACLQLQQRVEEEASGPSKTLECNAGLTESVVPIRVGETVIGYLQTGQVMLRAPSAVRFRATARQFAAWGATVDLARLKEAYFGTRVVSKAQYDSILRLLEIFAQHLSTLGQQLLVAESAAEPPMIAKARRFIAEHQGAELSLTQVARAAGMSSFYFCKKFKQATGLTFTHYVARVRIERVKQLLLNPHVRVSEAAFEAGFQSLSQFNRAFRKIAGEAPSAFRDQLQRHHRPAATGAPGQAIAHAA